MKKVLLSILLTLLPLLASAETVEIDGIWYNLVTKALEAEVTWNPNLGIWSGSYSGSIEIPASVTYNDITYNVTSIGDDAFCSSSSLTSVTIPQSVTLIGKEAFFWCTNLISVNIPYGIKKISNSTFGACQNLASISIPSSVTEIGGGAFSMCKFESLDIPNSVTNIGWAAFQNCISLTSISIPSSITTLSDQLFDGCTALTTITIPNSVTIIGSHAFYNCTNLKSIIIPNNVTTIESEAFRDCSSLNTITIPNSVKTIGENAFLNTGLASVTIGSGVRDIRAIAFKNCDELKDVYCLAEKISKDNSRDHEGLFTYPDAFQNSYPQYMTLHVPAASIEAYRSTEPWSNFNAIVPLEDGEIPVIQKCATPEISYENGKVKFTCETEGVDFITEVTVADAKKYYDSEFTLSQTYILTVYATKAGYENSDVATRKIVIENGQSSLFGDLNKDGKVNVADHVKLSEIILNK